MRERRRRPGYDTASLGPNNDADLVVNIDLRGYSRYSLEVITNAGAAVIPEANSANNSLSQDFSTNCK